ncbi:acyltransferase family protein [Novosphingobium cyanobacteriorum]|uniref:Acyltransferase n=1 Tax=Novosphingobium cyanobacteriorum TaxID=3024215 RepID=A0ABT6CP90_9SPHN|nr:acyltransferase [Novosphingobium cyanobacteriorum]MDF8334127.1 acyltransferase [Novosphingobium cyanobacteriorum]
MFTNPYPKPCHALSMAREGASGTAGGGRLVGLDGLRGIAAIFVLMLHFDDLSGVRGVFAHGYLAVDFFYMLSGFVLVAPIEAAPRQNSALRFMVARVARLWPLMALGVLLGIATHASAWGFAPVLPLIAMALFHVPRLDGNAMTFPLNQPQWSLEVELAANAAHLLLLRRLSVTGLLLISASCWIVLLPVSLREGSMQLGSQGDDWIYGFVRAGFAYPLGVVLGRHCFTATRRATHWLVAPALLLAVLLLPSLPGLPDALMDLLALLVFPAVLAAGALANVPPGIAQRFSWLGGISFPLYATHFPILEAAHVVGDTLPLALRAPLFLCALAACVWIAHLIAKSPLSRGIPLPLPRVKQLQGAA